MTAAAAIAAAQAAVKAGQKAWQAFCKGVAFKRKQIARAELEADNGQGKDLDNDGVVGGVGNTPRSRGRLRRGGSDRGTDAQRQVLDAGGNRD